MFKVGQVYKVKSLDGTGIVENREIEITQVLDERQAIGARVEDPSVTYGVHALMVEDGSLELVNPFSHLYKKESGDLYTIDHGSLKFVLDSRSFYLQENDNIPFRIYYDELENVLAVLLDIYENKVVKK